MTTDCGDIKIYILATDNIVYVMLGKTLTELEYKLSYFDEW